MRARGYQAAPICCCIISVGVGVDAGPLIACLARCACTTRHTGREHRVYAPPAPQVLRRTARRGAIHRPRCSAPRQPRCSAPHPAHARIGASPPGRPSVVAHSKSGVASTSHSALLVPQHMPHPSHQRPKRRASMHEQLRPQRCTLYTSTAAAAAGTASACQCPHPSCRAPPVTA